MLIISPPLKSWPSSANSARRFHEAGSKRASKPIKSSQNRAKSPTHSSSSFAMSASASSSAPRTVPLFDVQAILIRTQMQAVLRQAIADDRAGRDTRSEWGRVFVEHLVCILRTSPDRC